MNQLIYHISHLPSSIQKQVLDFIEFLLSRYRQEQIQQPTEKKYPLRGSVTFFDRPFDSVAEDDWEALA
ncbi:MAG: DUF2281 domain-containing protein [Bacteroidota bacterium]